MTESNARVGTYGSPCCLTCAAWDGLPDKADAGTSNLHSCHRHAPVLGHVSVDWPWTDAYDGCFDHIPMKARCEDA